MNLGLAPLANQASAPGATRYLRLATQTGIRLAVQLPQNAFMERVVSSKIVVECDIQTCWPQSEQEVTARPLQTEHLAIYFTPNFSCPTNTRRISSNVKP